MHDKFIISRNEFVTIVMIILLAYRLIMPGIDGSFFSRSQYYSYIGYNFNYTTLTVIAEKIAIILFWYLVIKNLKYLKKNKLLVFVCCIVIMFLWLIIDLFINDISLGETLFGNLAVTMCILPFGICLGFNTAIWNKIQNITRWLLPILIIFCWISCIKLVVEYGLFVYTGDTPAKEIYSALFVVVWMWLIGSTSKKNPFVYFVLVNMFLLAMFCRSRGWLIQSSFMILVVLFSCKDRNKLTNFFSGIVILCMALIVVSYFVPDLIESIIVRLGEDSRSSQYEQFFSQVSLLDLIIGGGGGATYTFNSWDNYKYIDNQILGWMFHYGIIPIFVFLYFAVKAIFSRIECLESDERESLRFGKFAILAYICAMLGLSIYFSIGVNINTVFIEIIIGRILYQNLNNDMMKRGNCNEIMV